MPTLIHLADELVFLAEQLWVDGDFDRFPAAFAFVLETKATTEGEARKAFALVAPLYTFRDEETAAVNHALALLSL